MDPKQQRLNVELGEKESEGIYSNLALISHSPSEFIIDFARVMPGVQKTRVYARIVMTPAHAKMLFDALGANIKKFEGTESLEHCQRIQRIRRIKSPAARSPGSRYGSRLAPIRVLKPKGA
jgi:hypothetical protein